jgi:Ca2+-binding RTX toxin-like protein
VKPRALFISIATAALMVAPAFANGITGSVAGARTECTITGTAADDTLAGTTRDDVICGKAGSDSVDALEGNDVVRGGQGDDGTGCLRKPGPIIRGCFGGSILRGVVTRGNFITFGLNGGDGSDIVRGQQDDDSIEGNDQSDKLYGGQGNDCLGQNCTVSDSENGNDFLKTKDKVSGNDAAEGGNNTDTCRIDAGDQANSCEL